MSKAGSRGGDDRAGRLASALRDNLRRRKAASRPEEGARDADADRGADAAAAAKTAENARER